MAANGSVLVWVAIFASVLLNSVLAQSCPGNETFQACPCGEGTCTDPFFGCGAGCDLPPGCYCLFWLVRNDDGDCVDVFDCPPLDCPPNQEYTTCGTCEPSCSNRVIGDCGDACMQPGCYCVRGTFRNEEGDCVQEDECPYRPCPPNEVYVDCGTCEPTCANPVIEACPDYCHPQRCYCVPGTVRDQQGNCVTVDQCPR